MRRISERSGFTLIEVMVASTLLCLVIIATVALFTSMSRLWRVGASGTSANMYASLAMRKLVSDMQEGQSASASGSHLFVQFPYYDTTSGSYHRNLPGELAEYYLSGRNGTEAPVANGNNCLWKQVSGNRVRLAKDLLSFGFDIQTSKSVRVSIKGADSEGVRVDPDLIQQSVTLRNN